MAADTSQVEVGRLIVEFSNDSVPVFLSVLFPKFVCPENLIDTCFDVEVRVSNLAT